MKTTDFRIGNYLQDREGRICRVEQLTSEESEYRKVKAYAIKGGLTGHPIKPIEITEDILIKAGFNIEELSDGSGYYYSLDLNNSKYCDLCISSGDKNGFVEVGLFPYEEWFRYKYVNQLQNLFYALTGEELKIEL